MSTCAKELSGWYEDTGFYSSVAFSDSTGTAAVKGIVKTATKLSTLVAAHLGTITATI